MLQKSNVLSGEGNKQLVNKGSGVDENDYEERDTTEEELDVEVILDPQPLVQKATKENDAEIWIYSHLTSREKGM